MNLFKYNQAEFESDVQYSAEYLLDKAVRDKELAKKIYALVCEEVIAEAYAAQSTRQYHITDTDVATILGIVIYNRLFQAIRNIK